MSEEQSDRSAEGERGAPSECLEKPSPARMYEYFLGGDNYFAVDREAAKRIEETIPNTREIAWENRWFLQRAVRFLAQEAGIRQFIDIGTGFPTEGSVHEIVQQIDPDARVVCVDNDPLVFAYNRGLLTDNETTAVITADARQPDGILGHPEVRRLIDFNEPVGVLLVAVLHFVTDEHRPGWIVRKFRDALASGSYLVLSHGTVDDQPVDAVARAVEVYKEATAPAVPRSGPEIEAFFNGWELVDPGFVRAWQWRPVPDHDARTGWVYAGVGRKPEVPTAACGGVRAG